MFIFIIRIFLEESYSVLRVPCSLEILSRFSAQGHDTRASLQQHLHRVRTRLER